MIEQKPPIDRSIAWLTAKIRAEVEEVKAMDVTNHDALQAAAAACADRIETFENRLSPRLLDPIIGELEELKLDMNMLVTIDPK